RVQDRDGQAFLHQSMRAGQANDSASHDQRRFTLHLLQPCCCSCDSYTVYETIASRSFVRGATHHYAREDNPMQLIKWDDLPLETVNESMQRKIITGERMTVARIWFTDGFLVPQHRHEMEQITQVVSGKMRFWFGADRKEKVDV